MTTAVLSRDALEERLSSFKAELDAEYAPSTAMHDIKQLNGFKRKAEADGSFGRMFNGPQWLDGVAIRDGVIQGAKLAATIVISSTFVTVDPDVSTTADRMELDTTSLRFYGTVSAVANTLVAEMGPTGFTLGSGSNKITFVSSTGVLTVPAAVITSLTIANVGGGVVGGTYKSSSSTAHLELSTSGIKAFNSGGTNTIFLDGTTGDLTITGTFTIQSATSGARTEIKSTGMKVFDSGGTSRAQLLNDGSGFVGSTTGLGSGAAVSWTTGGTTTINASRITTGSLAFGSGGTVNTTGTVSGTFGGLALANLSVSGTITIGSGGSIVNSDGDTWNQTGFVLNSAGSYGDSIKWTIAGTDRGAIYCSSTNLTIAGGTNLTNAFVRLSGSSATVELLANTNNKLNMNVTANQFDFMANGNISIIDSSGNFGAFNRIYPGNAGRQTTGYMAWDGTNIQFTGANVYVATYIRLAQSGTTASGALPGSPTKWFAMKENGAGSTWFVPAFSSNAPWTV